MKLSVSGVTATGFYITGLAVGASFGFVAGILFLAASGFWAQPAIKALSRTAAIV